MSFPFDIHSVAVSDSHLPCHAPTMPFFSRSQHSTAVSRRSCYAVALRRTAWSEHGMASVNQTRPHCVHQMGKTYSKPLAVQHGRGTAWARHGNGMLCVNRPLLYLSNTIRRIYLVWTLCIVHGATKHNKQRNNSYMGRSGW